MFKTLSHSTCSSARLFLLKSLFDGEKNMVLTDNEWDISSLANFSEKITGTEWLKIQSISEFWAAIESKKWSYILHPRLLETSGSVEYLRKKTLFSLKRWENIKEELVIEKLIEMGYAYGESLDQPGIYKKDGGILHIFDPYSLSSYSIEWFDTEIDSIIERKLTGERGFCDRIDIYTRNIPSEITRKEWVLNTEIARMISGNIALIGCDFLPYKETLLETLEKNNSWEKETKKQIHFTDFQSEHAQNLDISIPDIPHIDGLIAFLREKKSETIMIATKYTKSVSEFLEYNKLEGIEVIEIQKMWLQSFECTQKIEWAPVVFITDDIIGEIFVRTRTKKSIAKNLDLLLSLNPGDYVVHREHGIARFDQVITKTLWEIKREYIELHYAGGDKLFVPLTEIYRVSKYVWELEPELTKLSGKEWEKTLAKTDEELEKIAEELIELEAKRVLKKGILFRKFPKEEEKFLSAFPYKHTLDQISNINEIFRDMESEQPMDRLLSGDVGFWKTEVAMNAIYKAVLWGYQIAVISPLLVLADEHYETFLERLGEFWVRVGILTRMSSPSEVRNTLADMKNGNVDIVVGTHRLLSEDIAWKKLWLLVIDEEHKFWVSHKERIKKIKSNIDILSLSATPIPRSLNLALSGLKKISLLTTPPKLKKPIETIVSAWNEATIRHAIRYELDRGGQVIVVVNRIRGMESVEKEIEMILGEKDATKIIITHGRLDGEEIENCIHAFKKREYDILLTTTIIENGVNFLSANTIIILDPEDFGLAQLHQLRGRVGRKNEQGYCYLVYRKWELAADAKERIITIANNRHLGAGFEIAMRDMEIRGAWDVLGFKQAGKSKEIGLTLYFRMLEEKIESIKNEKRSKKPVKIELDIDVNLEEGMFLSETDKLNFFREIENIESIEELDDIENEMQKNKSGKWLFLILRARLLLAEYGVQAVKKNGVSYTFDFYEGTPTEKIRDFLTRFDKKNDMILLSVRKIKIETKLWKNAEKFLEDITRR